MEFICLVSRQHIELSGHEGVHIAATSRGIHGDARTKRMRIRGGHVIHGKMVGLHVIAVKMNRIRLEQAINGAKRKGSTALLVRRYGFMMKS